MKKSIFNRHLSSVVAIGIIVGIFLGCSTEKNTKMSRAYHNLTARYNVYFNGIQAYKAGVEKVDKAFIDNYTEVLPVFKYADLTANSMATSDMDIAIDKSSKLIAKHSITKKPKRRGKSKKSKEFRKKPEFCNWVDDSYFLMGRAFFYQNLYDSAMVNFQFVAQTYNKEEIRFDAMLWMARSYNHQKKYRDAVDMLQILEGDDEFPERLKNEFFLVYAEHYLLQKKYQDAVPHLDTVLKVVDAKRFNFREKKAAIRYKFILAQIFQRNKQFTEATELFTEVIDKKPSYDMAFSAQINRAMSYDVANGSAENIIDELYDMLDNENNIEYRDQIYYVLGDLAMREGKRTEATSFYLQSSNVSTDNKNQKALSCKALAEIYFEDKNYPNAQAYYDSTIMNLDRNYSNYDKVYKLSKNLTSLIRNLSVVQYEDSMQQVAQMSDSERDKLIQTLVQNAKNEKASEEAVANNANADFDPIFDQPQSNAFGQSNTGGKFYFYNPSSLSIGLSEFQKRWGKRKLEDNWRRSSKAVTMEDDEMDDNPDEVTSAKDTLDVTTPEYYLADLPLTDSLMDVSDSRIEKAIFKAGEIYKNKLSDYEAAIQKYEELNQRFPQTSNLIESYYGLFQCNREIGNTTRENYYKNKIINEFPNSRYAKIFTNPNYLKELEANKEKVANLYSEAYTLYADEDFAGTVTKCDDILGQYPENLVLDKLHFLRATAQGAMNAPDHTQLKTTLEKFVKDYPSSKLKPIALEIIKKIESGGIQEVEEKLYLFNEKAIHLYVVAVRKGKTGMTQLKFVFENFNSTNYSTDDFEMETFELNDSIELLTIKSYYNGQTALSYHSAVRLNQYLFKGLDKKDYNAFVISSYNFTKFSKDKGVKKYVKFFDENYSLNAPKNNSPQSTPDKGKTNGSSSGSKGKGATPNNKGGNKPSKSEKMKKSKNMNQNQNTNQGDN